jgi:hypothetical protein
MRRRWECESPVTRWSDGVVRLRSCRPTSRIHTPLSSHRQSLRSAGDSAGMSVFSVVQCRAWGRCRPARMGFTCATESLVAARIAADFSGAIYSSHSRCNGINVTTRLAAQPARRCRRGESRAARGRCADLPESARLRLGGYAALEGEARGFWEAGVAVAPLTDAQVCGAAPAAFDQRRGRSLSVGAASRGAPSERT